MCTVQKAHISEPCATISDKNSAAVRMCQSYVVLKADYLKQKTAIPSDRLKKWRMKGRLRVQLSLLMSCLANMKK